MKVALDISVPSVLWRGLPRARSLARETIAAAVAESGMAVRESGLVSLCLADDAFLQALNLRWRGLDEPTNVLSFPAAPALLPPRGGGTGGGSRGHLTFAAASDQRRAERSVLPGRRDPPPRPAPTRGAGARAAVVDSTPMQNALGDIALAYETLAREASELRLPLADHYRHLVAHGFLHLIGYDHETDEEVERMEALETRILARLGAADPYAREVVKA